jgi:hypothetical protein
MTSADGLSFEDLMHSSSDIIVFGSRAAGLERRNSDLDLLVISSEKGHKRIGKLDLIFIPEMQADLPIWKHTEIFRHIAAYGISLMHDRPLISAITDDYAALRKQRRLHRLVKSLLPHWQSLNDELKRKYITKVRRELQRYRLLREGLAVPPTVQLDSLLGSSNWIEFAFKDLGSATGISGEDATSAYQLLTNGAHRLRKELAEGTFH